MNSLDSYLNHHEHIMNTETFALLFEMNYIAMQDEALVIFKERLKDAFWMNGSLLLLNKNNQDFIMVTHSAQEAGKIQRTFFKNRVPTSHQTFDNLSDCIEKESIDWLTDYKIMVSE